jgi:hypothetical protein
MISDIQEKEPTHDLRVGMGLLLQCLDPENRPRDKQQVLTWVL